MVALPRPISQTVQAVLAAYEARPRPRRPHLGASVIGRPCERQLWYAFRWCCPEKFEGRMLRLFERGQREEEVFARELRSVGIEVHTLDPRTGQQFRFSVLGGHVGGSMDAALLGVLEAPKTWHVAEFKTHNAKSYSELIAKGVQQAKPDHWAQMQLYMRWSGISRAFYLAVNKNTDELGAERIREDKQAGAELEAKAERIVRSATPRPKMSENPAWFQCKFCPAHAVCHGSQVPPVSCRTCAHATPEMDGNARWSCAFHKRDLTVAEQEAGCEAHRYIPALLTFAEAVDADPAANWIEYKTPDGRRFRNGDPAAGCYTSAELAATDPAVLCDPQIDQARVQLGGRLVADDGPPPGCVEISAETVTALASLGQEPKGRRNAA